MKLKHILLFLFLACSMQGIYAQYPEEPKPLSIQEKSKIQKQRLQTRKRTRPVSSATARTSPARSDRQLAEEELDKAREYFADEEYDKAFAIFSKPSLASYLTGEDTNNMGDMYYEGKGVSKNYAEAVNWYRKAAEQGNAEAKANLGYIYRDGIGVVKNYNEALKWFISSAEQGNPDPQIPLSLGYIYFKGGNNISNSEKAKYWFKIAAESYNDNNAMNFLGIMYKDEDYKQAEKWFKQAVNNENRYAIENLINLYLEKKNFEDAGKYCALMEEKYGDNPIKNLANQGDSNSLKFMISVYLFGFGYSVNADHAKQYIIKLNENTDKDKVTKYLFLAYADLLENNFDSAVKLTEKIYAIRQYDWAVEFLAIANLRDNNHSDAKKWAKKISTPLTEAILLYYKCKNAMSVSDYDYCNKYQNKLNQIAYYQPFKNIEQELDISFKMNYKEFLPEKK